MRVYDVEFVVFTDCESCTRAISTNPGSMESGEYGLTRRTCFITCRSEFHAVAGLLWISWCVLGEADFSVFSFSIFFFFERTRPAGSMSPPCLIYLSTSGDCESSTRPISKNPGSMEMGEYGLTRGTCFFARRLELVVVAGLMWVSRCVFGGAIFSVLSMSLHFHIHS